MTLVSSHTVVIKEVFVEELIFLPELVHSLSQQSIYPVEELKALGFRTFQYVMVLLKLLQRCSINEVRGNPIEFRFLRTKCRLAISGQAACLVH
jgi:hypothetical protein